MPTLDNLATRFAHCVSLFRDPTAKAEQKKEFRALLGLLQDTAVTLRLAQGGSGIEANDVPCEGEGVAVLVERRSEERRVGKECRGGGWRYRERGEREECGVGER